MYQNVSRVCQNIHSLLSSTPTHLLHQKPKNTGKMHFPHFRNKEPLQSTLKKFVGFGSFIVIHIQLWDGAYTEKTSELEANSNPFLLI